MLGERPLEDISIEELATGAGISRPTFYFYFSSKDDVLLALLDQVISQVEHRVAALPRDFDVDPEAAWRRSIAVFVEVFTEHRAVSAAAITGRVRNAEVHDLWAKSMQTWVGYSTEVILAERARGAAPEGVDAGELATALNLMNERVLGAAFTGETPAIDHSHVLDVLSGIWIRSIYQ
ncbi:HTH-type transcriptional regulator EthR [Subtercola lobariae]|uniref:HTH-type transcriptional regulator EthR n=2 Tax=Subtercola lobariae TaxID=1588641 RepID=A0A917BAH9_9MICO|nr:HTH-type transcriptional regulator EthR [Subtercola lobariae]